MTSVQLLVNGLITAFSHADALALLRDPDRWINAFPHGSGFPHGKIRPLRKQYAPVTLERITILGAFPYIAQTNEVLDQRPVTQFAFAALLTLSSTESAALHYSITHATWLEPRVRNTFDGIVWSTPAEPGSFDHLTGEG